MKNILEAVWKTGKEKMKQHEHCQVFGACSQNWCTHASIEVMFHHLHREQSLPSCTYRPLKDSQVNRETQLPWVAQSWSESAKQPGNLASV